MSQQEVMEAIKNGEPLTICDIAKKIGCHYQIVEEASRRLERWGFIISFYSAPNTEINTRGQHVRLKMIKLK